MAIIKEAKLYYRKGSSDKVYNIYLVDAPFGKFDVDFEYGRSGTRLKHDKKNKKNSLSLIEAEKTFAALVNRQVGRGYKCLAAPKGASVASTASTNSATHVGHVMLGCQLLNDIDEEKAKSLLHDEEYVMEEKHDGNRMMIHCVDGALSATNKKMQLVSLPPYLSNVLPADCGDFCLDGENMNTHFVAFDLIYRGDIDMYKYPFTSRRGQLDRMFKELGLVAHADVIRLTQTASTTNQKIALYSKCFASNKEGVVFKLKSDEYRPCRSESQQFKYKFYSTASFIVSEINEKRSVGIELLNDFGVPRDVGNVAIPVNHSVPQVGDIVEVRYLYAFNASKIIYQPCYLGKRDDVEKAECLLSQLKYQPQ